jgi:hypothetical protein
MERPNKSCPREALSVVVVQGPAAGSAENVRHATHKSRSRPCFAQALARWLLACMLYVVSVTTAFASPPAQRPRFDAFPCPSLLTDHECRGYYVALAKESTQEARNAIMNSYARMERDREHMCQCDGVQDRAAAEAKRAELPLPTE